VGGVLVAVVPVPAPVQAVRVPAPVAVDKGR